MMPRTLIHVFMAAAAFYFWLLPAFTGGSEVLAHSASSEVPTADVVDPSVAGDEPEAMAQPEEGDADADEDEEPDDLTFQVMLYDARKIPKYRWFVILGVGASLLSDSTDSSYFAETLGVSLVAGYRISKRFALHLHVEQNTWRSQDSDQEWNSGVFNVGVGVDYEVISPHVHVNATFGASVLTFDTAFDEAGTTGIFFEFVPIDLRWVFLDRVILSFYPFSFHMEAPCLHEPGIRYMQYRTVLRVGGLF